MAEYTVRFHSVKQIAAFVSIANRQPFSVQIRVEDTLYDAKSLLSLFCLRLDAPLTVRVAERADVAAFARAIAPFLCDSLSA